MITREEYIEQYRQQHKTKLYGHTGKKFAGHIQSLINIAGPSTILDYGCGQCRMGEHLNLKGATIDYYDPAIEEISDHPVDVYDLVINTDVLEHIPEEDVKDVLQDIRCLSGLVFFNISTRPACTILPNGDNAHCTVKEAEWWDEQLAYFYPYTVGIPIKTKSIVRIATTSERTFVKCKESL